MSLSLPPYNEIPEKDKARLVFYNQLTMTIILLMRLASSCSLAGYPNAAVMFNKFANDFYTMVKPLLGTVTGHIKEYIKK